MNNSAIDLFDQVTATRPCLSHVLKQQSRLDAGYYSHDADYARNLLRSSGHPTGLISDLAQVFGLSEFSLYRILAANEHFGTPFLTVSDIQEFDPKPETFLSRKYETNLDSFKVKEGWVLISRSGSIGNVVYLGPELEGKAISNHALRIVPKDPDTGALIYVVLSGDLGRTLTESLTYGSVVGEIKSFQIEEIQIPVFSQSIRAK